MMRALWILALLAGVKADTEYVRAYVDTLESSDNSCNFTIKGRKFEIVGERPCNLLYVAFHRPTEVGFEITDGKHVSVGFADYEHLSHWRSRVTERESFQYQMEGKVRKVFINFRDYGTCHIAIDTGNKNIRHNNEYHVTNNLKMCNMALIAFYANQTIKLIGVVVTRENIPNGIIDLKYSYCSEKEDFGISEKEKNGKYVQGDILQKLRTNL
ncbi:uncharacterized protein LOC123309467 [Coccinella septempunctata]|uniref:uncharacterized protein LOC123309467 n=1 Tax=Coccinella septempunctata TaxID=41139 RepID=UPI001D0743FF|nr:uncharacterized protein LOC123309467 [Coccinella septempunctata]